MTNWIHPDAIDRVAASRGAPDAFQPASLAEVELVMRKFIRARQLRRIPKNPQDRRILLALVGLGMRRRYPYREAELNAYLKSLLCGVGAEVDYVTCRRYLVDTGIVKRDRAGARYLLNFPQILSTLSEDAMRSFEGWTESASTIGDPD